MLEFNDHEELRGEHAFLSPSKYHWIHYDEEKLLSTYTKAQATARGTELHEFASYCISLEQRLEKSKKTLNAFVNDSIGYKMSSEIILKYSNYCFGTADSIGFRRNILRIFDLKTGVTKASMKQLYVYAAIFCLEYEIDPFKLKEIDLRLYQLNEVICDNPDPNDIADIMKTIINWNNMIERFRLEE